jgi:hypothetical protein
VLSDPQLTIGNHADRLERSRASLDEYPLVSGPTRPVLEGAAVFERVKAGNCGPDE